MTFFNRVRFLAVAGGLTDFTVSTAVVGYRTPADASVPDGTSVSYVAQSTNLLEWEDGHGTYNAGVVSRDIVKDNSLNSFAKINFTDPPNVWFDCLAQDVRAVLTTNTTYYVATTGSDTAGDGSVGNPWATIQYAANFVMYNVTGEGVNVTIQVADGTYAEALALGPHQIFAPNSQFGTVKIIFSSAVTPGNLTLVPTTTALTGGGIISVIGGSWQIEGGFTVTFGASGNLSIFCIFVGGQLYGGSDGLSNDVAVVCTDHCPICVDAENVSNFAIGALTASSITFNSTVGTLVLCDQGSSVNFYPRVDIHFDVDPGFGGWAGGQPGMFDMSHGGGCRTSMRNTYSGASAAAPALSVISHGNLLYELNPYLSEAYFTVDKSSWHNGYTGGPLRVGTSIDAQTLDGGVVTSQISNNGFDWANASFAYSTTNGLIPGSAMARSRSATPGAQGLVVNGDGLGSFWFYGSDGASFQESAAIWIVAEGTPAAGNVPARIAFLTTSPGGVLTERVRINSAGTLIGTVAQLTPSTIAALPAAPAAGMLAAVSDGDPGLAWGATVVNSGAGSDYYLVTYNNTDWTVIGK